VQYAPSDHIDSYVRDSVPRTIQGYILARTIDPYQRPVAFVYAGSAGEKDGSDVFLNASRMRQSVNAQLMKAGHVYPAYYSARHDGVGGLPYDLRNDLTALAFEAWNHNRKIWSVDQSRSNPRIRNIQELKALAVWPKLYRRLIKYFLDEGEAQGLAGFSAWLNAESDRNDQVWIEPIAELRHLDDTLQITGNRIDMNYWPEELIIVPS